MTDDLPLVLVGCDFRVASSRYRSRLALTDEEATRLGQHLKEGGWADGLLVLDTCNRNEWVASTASPAWAAELLLGQMRKRLGNGVQPYVYTGREAARHLLRVAVGLESLVTGERQIAGQLFSALDAARTRGTSSRVINGLGTAAGRLVRVAIRRGFLGGSSTGVHGLAVCAATSALPAGGRVVVVGMGAIGRRVAALLDDLPRVSVVRVNRTVDPAARPVVLPLESLAEQVRGADALIVCTAARTPLVTPETLGQAPPVVVDIGIPEQVHRRGWPDGVRIVGLDELVTLRRQQVRDDGPAPGGEAEALVDEGLAEFVRFCALPPYAGILDALRRSHRDLASEAIPGVLREKLPDLSPRVRAEVEASLKAVLAEALSDVWETVYASLPPGAGSRDDTSPTASTTAEPTFREPGA